MRIFSNKIYQCGNIFFDNIKYSTTSKEYSNILPCLHVHIMNIMWEGLVDYKRMEWYHVQWKIKRQHEKENLILESFDRVKIL
jgi:hypothetical protein